MLKEQGFDLWADGYDASVRASDESDTYPFAGYRDVLESIYQTILAGAGRKVLDIGFGTGTLTARLYAQGCEIFGQDFSAKMLETAQEKMPDAQLYPGDFSLGLAEPLQKQRYDFIIATYSLHHLTDDAKAVFLSGLREQLNEGGKILIGDVAFETRAELEACREAAGADWDEDEIYFVASELRGKLPGLTFARISPCAGVLTLARTEE